MKLYEEYIFDIKNKKYIISGLIALIKFFRSKHNIGVKVTLGILVSLGLGSILLGIMRSLGKEENCEKIQDPVRKDLCKKTLDLKYIHNMIQTIDQGLSKLDIKKEDESEKIKHLKKDREKMVELRNKIEKEYRRTLDKLNRKY